MQSVLLHHAKGCRQHDCCQPTRPATAFNSASRMEPRSGASTQPGLRHESFRTGRPSSMRSRSKASCSRRHQEAPAPLTIASPVGSLSAINNLAAEESQFSIAKHSPILFAYLKAKMSARFVRDLQGDSSDTEHYVITCDFLNKYQKRTCDPLQGE